MVKLVIPHADGFTEVARRINMTEPLTELADLFGGSRWGTLQGITSDIHMSTRLFPETLPITTQRTILIMNSMEADTLSPLIVGAPH